MTPADLSRLRRWVGLPDSYLNFDPVGIEGDAQTLVEKMLGEGWVISLCSSPVAYSCRMEHENAQSLLATSKSRRDVIALVALAVCP